MAFSSPLSLPRSLCFNKRGVGDFDLHPTFSASRMAD
jgi:hypothetical protein